MKAISANSCGTTRAPLLSVRDLTIVFGSRADLRPAVDGLSFDLMSGETLAIVGESGSGKSVSAMSLLQLLPRPPAVIRAGTATFGGEDLLSLTEKKINRIRGAAISMIFQEPMTSLNPVLTIGRQLSEVVVTHQGLSETEARLRALTMLERVRIADPERRLKQYPHQLSGGMRQRVMIAMALACEPRILIADEPTTALDVTIQAQILDLIRDLKREFHTAVILITHDMGVVAEMAERVIVVRAGRKLEEGPVEDIFDRPQHEYTRALLRAVPRLGEEARDGSIKSRLLARREARPSDQLGAATDQRIATHKSLLEVKDLVVRFDVHDGVLRRLKGRVHAVEEVSFSIAAGETIGLVGESGSGKSTIGRAIIRLENRFSGRISIDGHPIERLDRRKMRPVRRLVQMVFQDPFASLNPRLEAGSQVAEPLVVHGIGDASERRDRVADLFRRVGLSPQMQHRFPHEFSGGQRQRLCIARALALHPKLIVADEAVSALDVTIKMDVLNLFLDLQEEFNLSYLFISHDIAVIERVAHRIAVMYMGRIVEIGPCHAVLADPRHPYTQRLLSSIPIADPRRARSRSPIISGEVKSPIRPVGWTAPKLHYVEVSPNHFAALDA